MLYFFIPLKSNIEFERAKKFCPDKLFYNLHVEIGQYFGHSRLAAKMGIANEPPW